MVRTQSLPGVRSKAQRQNCQRHRLKSGHDRGDGYWWLVVDSGWYWPLNGKPAFEKNTNSSGSSDFCFVFHYWIGMVPNKSKHYKNWLSIWESNQWLQDHTPDQTISTGDTNALLKNNRCKSSNSRFNPSWVWKIKKYNNYQTQLWFCHHSRILHILPTDRKPGGMPSSKNQGRFLMQPENEWPYQNPGNRIPDCKTARWNLQETGRATTDPIQLTNSATNYVCDAIFGLLVSVPSWLFEKLWFTDQRSKNNHCCYIHLSVFFGLYHVSLWIANHEDCDGFWRIDMFLGRNITIISYGSLCITKLPNQPKQQIVFYVAFLVLADYIPIITSSYPPSHLCMIYYPPLIRHYEPLTDPTN